MLLGTKKLIDGELAHSLHSVKGKKTKLQWGWFILTDEELSWVSNLKEQKKLQSLDLKEYRMLYTGAQKQKGIKHHFTLQHSSNGQTRVFGCQSSEALEQWTMEFEKVFLRQSISGKSKSIQSHAKGGQESRGNENLFMRDDDNKLYEVTAVVEDRTLTLSNSSGNVSMIHMNECILVRDEKDQFFNKEDGHEYHVFRLRDVFNKREYVFYCVTEGDLDVWIERFGIHVPKPSMIRAAGTPNESSNSAKGIHISRDIKSETLKSENEGLIMKIHAMSERMKMYEGTIDSYESELQDQKSSLSLAQDYVQGKRQRDIQQRSDIFNFKMKITEKAEDIYDCYEKEVVELLISEIVVRLAVENNEFKNLWDIKEPSLRDRYRSQYRKDSENLDEWSLTNETKSTYSPVERGSMHQDENPIGENGDDIHETKLEDVGFGFYMYEGLSTSSIESLGISSSDDQSSSNFVLLDEETSDVTSIQFSSDIQEPIQEPSVHQFEDYDGFTADESSPLDSLSEENSFSMKSDMLGGIEFSDTDSEQDTDGGFSSISWSSDSDSYSSLSDDEDLA